VGGFNFCEHFFKGDTRLNFGELLQIRGAELSPGLGVNGLEPSFFFA
jgi:hypothetical protein